jgi:long-chain-acyl-CoA dehydrogenase
VRRTLFEHEHEEYRDVAREFARRDVEPHLAAWDANHVVDRGMWLTAGAKGIIGVGTPVEYGGGGQPDFRYTAVLFEELAAVGAPALISSFTVQDPIVARYIEGLGTSEQKQWWLPGLADGTIVGAIALTEPDAGSDLQGIRTSMRRDGDELVLTGSKTFITNGLSCDIVIVFARSDATAGSRGFSLVVVECDRPGFSRGTHLDKIGLHAQDTAELFFDEVRVPADHLLGAEGAAFAALMTHLPSERLAIAMSAMATARVVYDRTVEFCRARQAFGQSIGSFQSAKFALAEMSTELDVAQAFLDACILAFNDRELSVVDAAKAKWWTTELQKRVTDQCVQLHGGYGYMREYLVARSFVDGRVQTIYGGTTEIMKEIIGRDIVNPR